MKHNLGFTVKRIICLIIAVIMALPLSAFAYRPTVGDEEKTAVQEFKKELITLKKLGVYSFDDISEVDAEKKITRAEFSEYLVSALNIAKVTDKVYFSDVKTDYWACGSINALVNLGAIDGISGNSFAPDDYITYAQACKVILSAAGYRGVIDAQNYSDPLVGYVTYAKRLKLTAVGVSDNSELTFIDAAQLLYNGMKMHSVLAVGDKAEVEDSTLFEAYRNVHIGTGRLESYIGGSINDRAVDNSDEVYINSIKFTADSDIDTETLFGNTVEVTYIKTSENDKRIIYLENVESTSDILEISSDETDSFDTVAYRIIYSKDADKKTKRNADLSKGAVIVYNGEVSEKRLSEIIKDFTDGNRYGSIKLIKTAGGGYDLCIVKSYENFVISNVNTDENVYYGKAYSMTELRLNDYERVNVFDSSGNSVSFPTAKDSLVAIAVSENKAYIEAVSCLNTVSGKVSVAKTNENKVTIDNVEYELANQCASENKVDSLLNITIKATLDLNGKIAVIIHQPTDDYKFAYLAKAVAKYDPFGSKPILKLYLPDSVELKDFEFADKTVIDGVSYKSDEIEKLLGAIPGTDVKKSGSDYKIKVSRQLIRYILNSDEKLSRIDTYNLTDGESADNTLTRGHDGETALLYNSSSTRFGMDCIYNSANTKVIFVPQVNADGDVSVGGVAMEETVDMYKGKLNIWNDRSYYAESYKTNNNNYYEDVIVIRMEPSKPDEIAFMFKEVIDAVDENNMPIKQLVGLYGTEVKYELDPQYGDLLGDIEEGDIIMADTDMTGKKAVTITKMFDRGTMTMVNDGKNPYWYANDFDITGNRFRGPRYQLSKSFVYGINNGIVRSTYDFYDMSKNITNEATVASSAAITVYDTSRRGDSVIKGTVSDIKAYESVGENCSVMVSFANYGAIKRIFIYNSK